MDKNVDKPRNIKSDISRYEDHKTKLMKYAEAINASWGKTGITPHQILSRATYCRSKCTVSPELIHPTGHNGTSLTPTVRKLVLDAANEIVSHYEEMKKEVGPSGAISNHPWYGVTRSRILPKEHNHIVSTLHKYTEDLKQLEKAYAELEQYLEVKVSTSCRLADIADIIKDLSILPNDVQDVMWRIVVDITPARLESLRRYFQQGTALKEHLQVIPRPLHRHMSAPGKEVLSTSRIAGDLAKAGMSPSTTLSELDTLAQQIELHRKDSQALIEPLSVLREEFQSVSPEYFSDTINGLVNASRLIEVVRELPPDLFVYRSELFESQEFTLLVPSIHKSIMSLTESEERLSEFFNMREDMDTDQANALGLAIRHQQRSMFRWFSPSWWKNTSELKKLASTPSVSVKALCANLKECIEHKKKRRSFESNERYARVLGEYFKGLETPIEEIVKVRKWYKKVRDTYGKGLGEGKRLGDLVLGLSDSVLEHLLILDQEDYGMRVRSLVANVDHIRETLPRVNGFQMSHSLAETSNSAFTKLLPTLSKYYDRCKEYFEDRDVNLGDILNTFERLEMCSVEYGDLVLTENNNSWIPDYIKLSDFATGEYEERVTRCQDAYELCELLHHCISNSFLSERILKADSPEIFGKLSGHRDSLERAARSVTVSKKTFALSTELNETAWHEQCDDELPKLINRNSFAIDKSRWLNSWCDFQNSFNVLKKYGFENLLDQVAAGRIDISQIRVAIDMSICDFLSNEIFEQDKIISKSSGKRQVGIQENFRHYDEILKDLQKQKIAYKTAQRPVPLGNGGGKVGTFTDLALIRHECGKKKRHIPIRQLIQRSSDALVALKPCFMMSPLAVSQYLPPGKITFDVIVIDEASQLRPEEALGAIARGKQFVIVGDPKQLPPTFSFRSNYEEDEEDVDAIRDSESILDASISLFKTRRLRWHYRSQHESLIAFSNKEFYESDLVVFPSPHKDNPEYGMKFKYLPEGRYSASLNHHEANTIVQEIRDHLVKRPNESLGVVAMNAKQADLIDECVENLGKSDLEFNHAYERNRNKEEPLFIKNLENVQGDERDVILISCTYGPDKDTGKVFQRFGDINKQGGWRRLNVLFTRSKKRMIVYSSLNSHNVLVSETSSAGIQAFRNFLGFAETGIIEQPKHTGREDASDFQAAVKEALRQRGYDCHSEIGVAGFFIDLAVVDPDAPGRYLLGVECDGAAYHSAKSVRDRDRLRQTILNRLGWNIHRVWSTDWFKNPEAEIDKIVHRLAETRGNAHLTLDEDTPLTPFEIPDESNNNNTIHDALSVAQTEFEADVIRHLTARGYECDAQVCEGSYSIDIAIRHPQKPGYHILGVECDGASFHSSRDKRSADGARQDDLEQAGWAIHRVWSNDWFSSPSKEIDKIDQRVHEILNESVF